MRWIRLVALPLAAVLVLAACSSAQTPGWTYAPVTPSPEPSGSLAPSGAPSSAPTAQPSGAPSGAPSGGPTGGPGGTLELVAKDIAFDKKELTVTAGEPFQIHLVNEDAAGVPHNVQIRAPDGTVLQDQDTIDGGGEVTYDYSALEPGTYTFICRIHPIPNMTGTLVVE